MDSRSFRNLQLHQESIANTKQLKLCLTRQYRTLQIINIRFCF